MDNFIDNFNPLILKVQFLRELKENKNLIFI